MQKTVRSSSETTAELRRLLSERILVLDGAWGTMLQGAKLKPEDYRAEGVVPSDHPKDVTGDPDLLILTRPDVILDVHRQYLAAGADITTTNTFTATTIAQSIAGLTPQTHVFLCGPPGLIEDLSRGFREQGVPRAHLHAEHFAFR